MLNPLRGLSALAQWRIRFVTPEGLNFDKRAIEMTGAPTLKGLNAKCTTSAEDMTINCMDEPFREHLSAYYFIPVF